MDQGINLFDCADVYPVKGGTAGDSAKLFGKALQLTPGLREKLVIVAKTGIIFPSAIDTSKAHLTQQINWFLESLQTTYVDVMLIHYSNAFMNATEVAETFAELKKSGKVLHFGVSNHFPHKIDVLQAALKKAGTNIQLITNEVEISVWNPGYLNYDSPIGDHAYSSGYRILAWGGLGGDPIGGLNRLFERTGTRQTKILSALDAVGAELQVSNPAVVALAWTLSHPSGIIPLVGTSKTSRVNELVQALEIAPRITNEQWWKIGGAGGLCPLGDSECNYDEYKA